MLEYSLILMNMIAKNTLLLSVEWIWREIHCHCCEYGFMNMIFSKLKYTQNTCFLIILIIHSFILKFILRLMEIAQNMNLNIKWALFKKVYIFYGSMSNDRKGTQDTFDYFILYYTGYHRPLHLYIFFFILVMKSKLSYI